MGPASFLLSVSASSSYNFTTIPLMDHPAATTAGSSTPKPLELTLHHLRKSTTYLVVVRPFNRYGEGPLSPAASAATFEDVPSAGPASVACSASSSQSVDVTWTAPPAPEQNGKIQQYRVHYAEVSSAGPMSRTVDGLYVTLTGLSAHTTYRIRVEALTRKGAGPLSPPVSCLTEPSVPGPPADVKALGSTSAVILCWAPPAQPNGELLHYTVSLK